MSERYPHLFSPLQIGPVTARNRIMQTAHVKLFTTDGIDSLRNVAYQVERAKGGAGLLITGNRLIHPTSTTGMARFAYQYLKGALEIDRKMTSGVHEHGALMFAQLNHFGLNATSDSADDLRVLWGPSAVKSPAYGETPKAMEHEDIAEVVEWWARSAELAREGGFDGTEVHIAHSYLLHQFLSPRLQQARRRVRRLAREPAPLHARGDRRGAPAHRRRLGDRHPADAVGVHGRGRARHRGREGDRAAARVDGASSTSSTSARPATTTSSRRSSPPTCRTASSST